MKRIKKIKTVFKSLKTRMNSGFSDIIIFLNL